MFGKFTQNTNDMIGRMADLGFVLFLLSYIHNYNLIQTKIFVLFSPFPIFQKKICLTPVIPGGVATATAWRSHYDLTVTVAFIRSSLLWRSHGASTACIELSRRAHCVCTARSRSSHCADGVLFDIRR